MALPASQKDWTEAQKKLHKLESRDLKDLVTTTGGTVKGMKKPDMVEYLAPLLEAGQITLPSLPSSANIIPAIPATVPPTPPSGAPPVPGLPPVPPVPQHIPVMVVDSVSGMDPTNPEAPAVPLIPAVPMVPDVPPVPVEKRTTRRDKPLHPSELHHLSASSIELFGVCPHKWAQIYLWGEPREASGEYALIGTAHHAIFEHYLKNGDMAQAMACEEMKAIPKKEHENIVRYLNALQAIRPRIHAVEEEILLKFADDAPPIQARIDARFNGEDGIMTVLDHKSNRRYDSPQVWKSKAQGRIYPYLMHRLGYDVNGRVRMMFGYSNIDVPFVEFEYWAAEVEETQEWLNDVYRRMCEYYDSIVAHPDKVYMAFTNEWCPSCSFRNECPPYKEQFENLKSSVEERLFPASGFERYRRIDAHLKAVTKLFEQCKDELRATINASPEHLVMMDGYEVFLQTPTSRRMLFSRMWPAFHAALVSMGDEADEVFTAFMEMCDEVFSVKIGGIDKLFERFPGLVEHLAPFITEESGETQTIKYVKSTK